MRLQRKFIKEPRKPKSGDVLGQAEEAQLELGTPQVEMTLIQVKEESGLRLDQNALAPFSLMYKEDFSYDQFRIYCESVFASRILFPQNTELGRLRPSLLHVPRQQREVSRRFQGIMEEDDWEYLLLLNPRDWRKLIQPEYNPIPAAAEFLFEFSKARQRKHWSLMMKMGLVLTQVYPETIPQIQTILREMWPSLMQSAWGLLYGQLDAEIIALGLLICPDLRTQVNIQGSSYLEARDGAINRLDWKELAWFKMIEAEEARFNDTHDLVMKFAARKSKSHCPELPQRPVLA